MNCTLKIEKRKNKVVPLEGCTVESAVKEEDTRTEMTRMTQTNFWTNWHQIVTQIITIEWQELESGQTSVPPSTCLCMQNLLVYGTRANNFISTHLEKPFY